MAERDDRRSTRPRDLLRYTRATAIVGDILKIRAHDVGLGDMALVEIPGGEQSLAQAIQLEGDEVSLQVFGGQGLSTQATVRFLGHPTQVTYSPNILGRVFRGDGQPMDGGPNLSGDRPGRQRRAIRQPGDPCHPDADDPHPSSDDRRFQTEDRSIEGRGPNGIQRGEFEPARTPYDWLSRDPAAVDAYVSDRLCGFALQPQALKSFADAPSRLADPIEIARVRLNLPIYILAGERDPINHHLEWLKPLAQRYRAAGLTDVTEKEYPGGRHEMLNEINRDEVLQDLLSWTKRSCPVQKQMSTLREG